MCLLFAERAERNWLVGEQKNEPARRQRPRDWRKKRGRERKKSDFRLRRKTLTDRKRRKKGFNSRY